MEKGASDVNYNFSGVAKPQNDNSFYGLRYSDFIVPLAKALQELNVQNEALTKKLNDLSARLQALENK